jgi:hypothetical protein
MAEILVLDWVDSLHTQNYEILKFPENDLILGKFKTRFLAD